MQQSRARANGNWTEDEDRILVAALLEGLLPMEAAPLLPNRSAAAIMTRASRLQTQRFGRLALSTRLKLRVLKSKRVRSPRRLLRDTGISA